MKKIYLAAVTLMTLCATSTAVAQTYQYNKLSAAPEDWSGTYLIVHENDSENTAEVFDGSLTDLDVKGNFFMADCNYKNVNGTEIRVIESSTKVDAATWTVTRGEQDGIYYVQSASGFWIGYNSTDPDPDSGEIEPDLKFANDKTYDLTLAMEAGKTNVVVTSKNGFELRFNSESGKQRFRFHASGKKKAIKFYVKTDISTSAIDEVRAASEDTTRYTLDGRKSVGRGLCIEQGRVVLVK